MSHTNNTTSAAVPHKPTMGEKISGTVDSIVGKVTSNPAKVAEGEAKKTGQPLHGVAAGASEAVHGNNNSTHSGTGLHPGHSGSDHSSALGHSTSDKHGGGLTGPNSFANNPNDTALHHQHHDGKVNLGNNSALTGNHSITGDNLGHSHTGGATGLNPTHDSHSHTSALGHSSHSGAANTFSNTPHDHSLTGNNNHNHSHTGGATGLNPTHDSHSHTSALGHSSHTGAPNTFSNTHHDNSLTGNHGALGAVTGNHGTSGGLTGHNDHSLAGNNHGTHGTHGVHDNTKPSLADKLTGGAQATMGKVTHNPTQVMEGEAKQAGQLHQGNITGSHTTAGAYDNTNTGNRF